MSFRAYVEEDFIMQTARLVIVQDRTDSRDILMSNGSWANVSNEVLPSETPGVAIPHDALPALAEAINRHLGNSIPSKAEVAVLREVLEVERDRVNDVLFAHREAFERRTL